MLSLLSNPVNEPFNLSTPTDAVLASLPIFLNPEATFLIGDNNLFIILLIPLNAFLKGCTSSLAADLRPFISSFNCPIL